MSVVQSWDVYRMRMDPGEVGISTYPMLERRAVRTQNKKQKSKTNKVKNALCSSLSPFSSPSTSPSSNPTSPTLNAQRSKLYPQPQHLHPLLHHPQRLKLPLHRLPRDDLVRHLRFAHEDAQPDAFVAEEVGGGGEEVGVYAAVLCRSWGG